MKMQQPFCSQIGSTTLTNQNVSNLHPTPLAIWVPSLICLPEEARLHLIFSAMPERRPGGVQARQARLHREDATRCSRGGAHQ